MQGGNNRKEGIENCIGYYSSIPQAVVRGQGRSKMSGRMMYNMDKQWRWHSWRKLGGRGDLSLLGVAPNPD